MITSISRFGLSDCEFRPGETIYWSNNPNRNTVDMMNHSIVIYQSENKEENMCVTTTLGEKPVRYNITYMCV